MLAGELNEVISILRPTTVISDTGAEKVTYTSIGSFRAKVVYGKGWRSVVNDEIFYSKSVYFSVRDYCGVKNTDIVTWNGERYRIHAIEHRREDMAKEITAELIHE